MGQDFEAVCFEKVPRAFGQAAVLKASTDQGNWVRLNT